MVIKMEVNKVYRLTCIDLNHEGIGLDDKIEDVPFEMLNSDDDAFGPSSGEEIDELDEMEEVGNRLENISEQEVDTSELDGMF